MISGGASFNLSHSEWESKLARITLKDHLWALSNRGLKEQSVDLLF